MHGFCHYCLGLHRERGKFDLLVRFCPSYCDRRLYVSILSEATFAQPRAFKVVFNCNIVVYLVPQCEFDNVKGSSTFYLSVIVQYYEYMSVIFQLPKFSLEIFC